MTAKYREKIGASRMAGLCGMSRWSNPTDEILDFLGLVDPWPGNDATRLGQAVEPYLMEEYSRRTGHNIRRAVVRSDSAVLVQGATIIRVHLDCWDIDDTIPIEIKTSGLIAGAIHARAHEDWGDEGTDQVPREYMIQVHGQMAACDAERARILAWLGGQGIYMYEIARCERLVQAIRDTCHHAWMEYVVPWRERQQLVLPPFVPHRDTLTRMPRRAESTTDLADDVWRDLETLATRAKDAARELEEYRCAIINSMGDAEIGRRSDGQEFRFREVHRRAYSVPAGTYRKLTVGKTKGNPWRGEANE